MDEVKATIIQMALASILATAPAGIAKRKGRSFLGWWCYGFLMWIIALPHAMFLKSNHQTMQNQALNSHVDKKLYP